MRHMNIIKRKINESFSQLEISSLRQILLKLQCELDEPSMFIDVMRRLLPSPDGPVSFLNSFSRLKTSQSNNKKPFSQPSSELKVPSVTTSRNQQTDSGGWTFGCDPTRNLCTDIFIERSTYFNNYGSDDDDDDEQSQVGIYDEFELPASLVKLWEESLPDKSIASWQLQRQEISSSWRRIGYIKFVGTKAKCVINIQRFFDPIVDEILKIIDEVLNGGMKNRARCNKVLLVGGFSASKYLQRAIHNHFRFKNPSIQITIPNRPDNAVLKGAFYLGSDERVISARRSKYCYGTSIARKWTDDDDKCLASNENKYPIKMLIEGKWYASGIFFVFLKRNHLVPTDKTVEHTFSPLRLTQEKVGFDMLRSKKEDVKYSSESNVEKISEVIVSLPEEWQQMSHIKTSHDMELTAKMKFGTEVTFQAMEMMNHTSGKTKFPFEVIDQRFCSINKK